MKSIADRNMLKRQARFSQATGLDGIGILIGDVALSLLSSIPALLPEAMLLAGFGIATIGTYYANPWGRSHDQRMYLTTAQGRWLPHSGCIIICCQPTHILLMSSSIMVFDTVSLDDKLTYDEARRAEWFNMGRALRSFVKEPLGDPIRNALNGIQLMRRWIARSIPDTAISFNTMVVFTHPNAKLNIDYSPIPVRNARQLSKHIPMHHEMLSTEVLDKVCVAFDDLDAFK